MTPRRLLVLLSALLLLGGCGLFGGGEGSADQTPGAGPDPDELPLTGWSDVPADEVGDGGTLRLAVGTVPATFNPAHADAGTSFGTSELERLLGPTSGSAVRITEDGGWEVDENYAESVEVVQEDPLTVRVRLNPDAVWEKGSPITAADMRAYWQAMNGSGDAYRVSSTEGFDDISSVEEGDDELEYDVTFERARSDWPRFVYPRLPSSISADAERFNEAYTEQAVPSNGPFVITGIDLETGTVTQERNPRWWGPAPRLEAIQWRVAALDVQAEAYDAEELDVIDVDSETAGGVDAERLRRAAGSRWSHLTLNAGGGPLEDPDVRRAVALALDREEIATDGVEGLSTPARVAGSLFTVPGQQGYSDAAGEVLGRDVEQARGLLEGAGYEVGEETTRDGEQLTLTLPVPEDSPGVERRAEVIAGDLAEIGIAVESPRVPLEDFSEAVLVPLDFDLVTFSWDASVLGVESAQSRFRPVDSPANLTGVESGRAGTWSEVAGALDDENRHEAATELDTALLERFVMVPLAVQPSVMAVRENVVNLGPSSFEKPDYTVVGFSAQD
ncbi:ABC transporter family substrate-binding protein [Aeromicrobium sp. CF4.19]|uniref:ABC transporter family substrate-binding protein n=1 Tax=Aeromicrobium sp. CF4.19 TaxID=3373082 RepID=UPI003EE6EBEC